MSTPAAQPDLDQKRWFPWMERIPLVITGTSGAGKTEVWRHMTGGHAPDVRSSTVEEGYLFPVRRRSRVTISAIPGQTSKERYEELNFYFDPAGRLSGVIFVASFGFDRVWPDDVDLVANNLSPFSMNALRQRNIERELESFKETCEQLRRRNLADRNVPSPWLLVIVNKADLYFSDLVDAASYYLPSQGGPFDQVVTRLRNDLGNASGFRYEVVPACLRAGDYSFSSYRGSFLVPTQLTQGHAHGSVNLIIETVKELTYA